MPSEEYLESCSFDWTDINPNNVNQLKIGEAQVIAPKMYKTY
jgi:hypothetical protein